MTVPAPADIASFANLVEPQLTDVRASVSRAFDDIDWARSRASARLRAKHRRARAAAAVRRRAMDQANTRMIAAVVASQATSAAMVADWRAHGEVEKLVSRAERAEDFALAAVRFAWGSMEEACAAILEAVVARFDADEATAVASRVLGSSSASVVAGAAAGGAR
jgi:hypothetical protein